jgi:tetrahydrodipicolinate N-succinyltransferase
VGLLNKLCKTIGAGCYMGAAAFALGGLYILSRGDLGAGLMVLLSAPVAVVMAEGLMHENH